MTTYFVIVIFGAVMATVGPLPMPTCQALSKQMTAQMDESFLTIGAENMPPVGGRTVQRDDVFTACYVQDDRPEIGERVTTD